jgi:hypothetical protein
VSESWLQPAAGWHKANADGDFLKVTGTGGSDAIIRDHHGGFQVGACRFLPYVSDPKRAEIFACKLAL